jgi:hypothetical protein
VQCDSGAALREAIERAPSIDLNATSTVSEQIIPQVWQTVQAISSSCFLDFGKNSASVVDDHVDFGGKQCKQVLGAKGDHLG